jgi:hypothetical protein
MKENNKDLIAHFQNKTHSQFGNKVLSSGIKVYPSKPLTKKKSTISTVEKAFEKESNNQLDETITEKHERSSCAAIEQDVVSDQNITLI